ncbi:MAG: carboxymuconolactone decarboxylase family protein [Gemmataceae bacterium]
MNLLDDTAPKLGRREQAADAWAKLPPPTEKTDAPLPAWAAALAPALPKTTAAMLELDHAHRAKSPLDPKLRAAMRWVAARANGSAYGQAYAVADLRLAGATDAEVRIVQGDPAQWPTKDRAALTLADKLTTAAYTVRDDEVVDLRKRYGDARVVAMVQLLAYANFQDRLTQALSIGVEAGGPLPPLGVTFAKPIRGGVEPPPRQPPVSTSGGAPERIITDTMWRQFDFASLKKQMEVQKAREPRIPVPSFESVRKYLPPTYPKDRELKIKWSLVCMGYQPELASAWSQCTRQFGEESKQDRVFEESLFWVVTRSLQCFY